MLQVDALALLPLNSLQQVRDKMIDCSFSADEVIATAGAAANRFYMLQSGSVACADPEKPDEGYVLEEGQWFGEQALLPGHKSDVTVVAQSDIRCLVLSRQSLEMVAGPLQAFFDRAAKEREAQEARYDTKLEQEGLLGSTVGSFKYKGVSSSSAGSAMVLGTHATSGKKYTLRFESKSYLCSDAALRRRPEDDAATAVLSEESILQRMVTRGPVGVGEPHVSLTCRYIPLHTLSLTREARYIPLHMSVSPTHRCARH